MQNKLNDLSPREWIKFQKSWFVHNPPPRQKNVLCHPAKYPETLAQQFIEFFTKKGQVVLDPMVGTGSTLVAALKSGRHGYGIELNPIYSKIAQDCIQNTRTELLEVTNNLVSEVITANASDFPDIIQQFHIPVIDYVLTSPPYWDMLHAPGAKTQEKRRCSPGMDVIYSDDPQDLGNVSNYEQFIYKLAGIYKSMKPYLRHTAYITVIVKNIKKKGKIYPLAWDLAKELSKTYTLKDEKIWVQDNQKLAPYGLGNAWVSNTFHHYCLQFRNDFE
jgi:DNA modification methylase